MRILHTADWHLGHTLHDVDRETEHRAFLGWLVDQLGVHAVDALLVAGDIFDTANPSAASQQMWFDFLARALRARPTLQIVAIAGNHDSAARLEATDPLLRAFDIRVVGSVSRLGSGQLDPTNLLVTLKDATGTPRALAIAMPFLRPGDLPAVEPEEGLDALIEGVRAAYGQAIAAAAPAGLPLLAMGHCYMVDGRISELSERKVLGGNQHALPASVFPEAVGYAALGHLHLAQALGNGRIHYAGSPIPLAMGERHYTHAVRLVELGADGVFRSEGLPVPRTRDLLRVPETGYLDLEQALEALRALPERTREPRPILEVGVALEKPQAMLRATLLEALEGKGCILGRIDQQRTGSGQALGDQAVIQGLKDLPLEDVFRRKWAAQFKTDPGPAHLEAFHELHDQVNQEAAR